MDLHIHVGHNVPGYLPESDTMCFDSVEDALEALRHEIKDQQDYYFENCTAETPEQQEKGSDCCEWCSVALNCEAALAAIADGDAEFYLTRESEQYGRIGWIFTTPEGPDMHHWAARMDDLRNDCEIFADQEA